MANKVDPSIYQAQQLITLFNMEISKQTLRNVEKKGDIPQSQRKGQGKIQSRVWHLNALPKIGEKFGFLKHLKQPTAMTVFAMKGGVLKTTLAFNIARLAALHNIRTCVIGLDLQGDISAALGYGSEPEADDLSALQQCKEKPSLFEFFTGKAALNEILVPCTELPTLSLIPESPSLAHLDLHLVAKTQREFWLKRNIVDPLRKDFELIIMDCPPNWSPVVSNALTACDVLVSPLETKINHYRNHEAFIHFLNKFCTDSNLNPLRVFVPTRFINTRKLASEIRSLYSASLSTSCTSACIRESQSGEDAMAAGVSVPELVPTSVLANDIRDLLREIWSKLPLAN